MGKTFSVLGTLTFFCVGTALAAVTDPVESRAADQGKQRSGLATEWKNFRIENLLLKRPADLDEKKATSKGSGIKKFRTFIEHDDAKQAKDLLGKMIENGDGQDLDEAVVTFGSLSPSRQAEITAEFSAGEREILDRILSRINHTNEKQSQ